MGGPLMSISVHLLLQMDLLIILRVWAKAEEGVGEPSIQTAFKACRSPKLTSRYLQNGSYPPALGTLCNQSLFLKVPKGFGEVTSNTADKELSHLVPLKLSASSRGQEKQKADPLGQDSSSQPRGEAGEAGPISAGQQHRPCRILKAI